MVGRLGPTGGRPASPSTSRRSSSRRPTFVDDLKAILAETGLAPSALVLEMTETVLFHDTSTTIARLEALRDLGVRIAIDDFGTGYSSLGYLRRFQVDILKIAREFIGPADSEEDWAFAAAIVALGRTLGLTLIAEGIEEPRQLARLRELGCELGQGFLFARPQDAAATADLLKEQRRPMPDPPAPVCGRYSSARSSSDRAQPRSHPAEPGRRGAPMFILYAIVVGLALGLVSGGRPAGLAELHFRWAWLIVAGLLVQVVLFSGRSPRGSATSARRLRRVDGGRARRRPRQPSDPRHADRRRRRRVQPRGDRRQRRVHAGDPRAMAALGTGCPDRLLEQRRRCPTRRSGRSPTSSRCPRLPSRTSSASATSSSRSGSSSSIVLAMRRSMPARPADGAHRATPPISGTRVPSGHGTADETGTTVRDKATSVVPLERSSRANPSRGGDAKPGISSGRPPGCRSEGVSVLPLRERYIVKANLARFTWALVLLASLALTSAPGCGGTDAMKSIFKAQILPASPVLSMLASSALVFEAGHRW